MGMSGWNSFCLGLYRRLASMPPLAVAPKVDNNLPAPPLPD